MTELDAMLAGIVADPREETRWLVLADWLQEFDDPRRAELLRLHRCMLATCCEPGAHPQRAEWQTRMVELLVAGVKSCVPQETLTLPGGVPMTFSFIPPGAFLMGSETGADDMERPVLRVEVSSSFFMGVSAVTQAQWKALMDTEPSKFTGLERPVEQVSWDDSQELCARLSSLTGYRVGLPTEAEWEYACRAGTTTEYYFGDTITTDLANFDGSLAWEYSPEGEYRKQTTNVGSFPANAWGLSDLHGNVWEWCAGRSYSYSTGKEWWYPEDPDTKRTMRGGGWAGPSEDCRAAFRGCFQRAKRDSAFGLRVCLRL